MNYNSGVDVLRHGKPTGLLTRGARIINERAGAVLLPYAIFGFVQCPGLKLKEKR
jgi:hypothetical protein